MADTLNVGLHFVGQSFGQYVAAVADDGGVIIETIFSGTNQKHTVRLSCEEWDRLAAWVEWKRKDQALSD